MSHQRDVSLNERISNIKSTLDEMDMALSPNFSSFDSSRNPPLMRRPDSIASFSSDQSLEKFLNQQREMRTYEHASSIEAAGKASLPSLEEDRPLAAMPQKWDGTFNKGPQTPEEGSDFQEAEPSSFHKLRPPRVIKELQAENEHFPANVTSLQAELYMKLEDCQRELDYARNYSIEQETQAALRIEELERALEEALQVRERREDVGEPLAGKLHDAEARFSEADRRARMWEERYTHSEERLRVLEERNKVLEERSKNTQERSRQTDVNYRKLEDSLRLLQRERDSLHQELLHCHESTANSDAVSSSLREEVRRLQQDLRVARERVTTSESVISELQQENSQVARLSDLLSRKETEMSRTYEEKCAAEQRSVELQSRLKQHEDLSLVSLEARVREAEQRATETWTRKTLALEASIAHLTADKDNLTLELRMRPTVRYVRELENKLEDLEFRISKKRHRHVSMSVTPTGHHSRSVLRDNRSFDVGHKHRQCDHSIVHQLLAELREENASALLSRVRGLLQAARAASSAERLLEKLRRLVLECSPPDSGKPTAKQVWQWVRRVVEDFMQLKGDWEQVILTVGAANRGEALRKVVSLATCEKMRQGTI